MPPLPAAYPSFENDDCALRGPEIGLLNELKRGLKAGQSPFVVGEVHFGMFGDRAKSRAARDSEASRIRCAVDRQISIPFAIA